MFIYPYKVGSNSVRVLKEKLGAKIIKLQNSNFKGGDKIVLNWGNSTPNEEVEKCIVLNRPENVALASNKKTFFECVEGQCNVPPFTLEKAVAEEWCNNGKEVVVREKLTGNSGEGIVILSDPIEFGQYNHANAKLYVKYIPKKQEYRVHVMGGMIMLVQRKAKPHHLGKHQVNYKVRSHDNGFVFVKNEGPPPEQVIDESVKAIKACGLDFGAVDVIYNEYYSKAYVLEINTAPGLEGTTPDNYVEVLQAYANMIGEMKPEDKRSKSVSDLMSTLAFSTAGGNVWVDEAFAQPQLAEPQDEAGYDLEDDIDEEDEANEEF